MRKALPKALSPLAKNLRIRKSKSKTDISTSEDREPEFDHGTHSTVEDVAVVLTTKQDSPDGDDNGLWSIGNGGPSSGTVISSVETPQPKVSTPDTHTTIPTIVEPPIIPTVLEPSSANSNLGDGMEGWSPSASVAPVVNIAIQDHAEMSDILPPPNLDILSTNDPSQRRSIYWDTAYTQLSEEHKHLLRSLDCEKLDEIFETLRQQTSMAPILVPVFDGGRDTKPIMTRGRIYSILRKVERYSSLLGSSIAAQQYPDVTALLWAGIKCTLNLTLNDLRTFDAISATIEEIVDTICSCENHDQIFFPQNTGNSVREDILSKIPPIYSVCLEFIAEALKYARKGNLARWVTGTVNSFQLEFQPIIDKLRQLKAVMEKLAMEAQYSATTEALKVIKFGEKKRAKILDWVSVIKPVDHHYHARRNRTIGTGKWLFEKPEFTRWIEGKSSVLWLYGRAGSGKTVLSSTVVDTLHATFPHVPVLYFYCNYKEESRQQVESIVRTLYKDLVAFARKELDQKLIAEYKRIGDNSSCIDFNTAKRLFLAEASKYNMLFLVVDALDECNKHKVDLVQYLADEFLNDYASHGHAKIFFTSRHDSIIQKILAAKLNYEIDANDTSKDIRPFIEERLDRMIKSGELLAGNVSEGTKIEIIEALCDKAGGMFLWVDFQLKAISEQANLQDIRQQLRELPDDMDETYRRMFTAIAEKPARVKEWAYRTLMWVFGAAEPLTPEQLVQATAVQIGTANIGGFASSAQYLIDLCCHMVVIDKNADRVRFVHFSVQEYLARQPRFELVHQHLGRVCLTVMGIHNNMDEPERGVIESFYVHAAKHLQNYAEGIDQRSYSEIAELLMQLRIEELEVKTYSRVVRDMLYNLQSRMRRCRSQGRYPSEVEGGLLIPVKYIMAYYNLSVALRHNLEISNIDPKTISELLLIAVDRDYVRTVQVMAEFNPCSVNIHHKGKEPTALYLAAQKGFREGVQILLEAGADVNVQGGKYGNALQAAVMNGRSGSAIVDILLQAGAAVDAEGGTYGNALQAAAWKGNIEVVEMLLEAGAEVNAEGGAYGNALQAAAWRGKTEVVEMLLQAGVEDSFYDNALQEAARRGNTEMVEILLKAGAEVNAEGGFCGNALQLAAWTDKTEVVKTLLEAGAEVNAQGGFYGNALQAAAWRGNTQVVEILLKAGAEINAKGGEYGNALQAAAHRGAIETLAILLEAGADVTARGGKYETALKAAKELAMDDFLNEVIEKDVEGLVEMLVEAGATE